MGRQLAAGDADQAGPRPQRRVAAHRRRRQVRLARRHDDRAQPGEGRERLRGVEAQLRKGQAQRLDQVVGLGRRDRRRHVGDRMVDVGRADQHRALPDMGEHRAPIARMQPGEAAGAAARVWRANTRWLPRSGRSTGAPGAAPAQTPAACTVTVAVTSARVPSSRSSRRAPVTRPPLSDQGGLDMVEGARTRADGVEDQAQHQPGVVDDAVAVGDRRAQAVAAERRLERQRFRRRDAPRGAPAGHAVGDPERRAEGERPRPAAFVDRHHERLRLDQPGSLAQQALALAHRLERHPPLPRLEVAHAAVDQLRRPRRGAAGEVAAVDQQAP